MAVTPKIAVRKVLDTSPTLRPTLDKTSFFKVKVRSAGLVCKSLVTFITPSVFSKISMTFSVNSLNINKSSPLILASIGAPVGGPPVNSVIVISPAFIFLKSLRSSSTISKLFRSLFSSSSKVILTLAKCSRLLPPENESIADDWPIVVTKFLIYGLS